MDYLNNNYIHKKMPKLIDGSKDPERIARESLNPELQRKGISYCNNKGELIWLALPRKTKLHLERRSILAAKDTRGYIILFKRNDAVDQNNNYRESYHFHETQVGNDYFAFSNNFTHQDYRCIAKYLKISEITHIGDFPKQSFLQSIKTAFENLLGVGEHLFKRQTRSLLLIPSGHKTPS